ncbi:hypothetical protein GCM10017750_14540 [Streptomyces racemochromogenes]
MNGWNRSAPYRHPPNTHEVYIRPNPGNRKVPFTPPPSHPPATSQQPGPHHPDATSPNPVNLPLSPFAPLQRPTPRPDIPHTPEISHPRHTPPPPTGHPLPHPHPANPDPAARADPGRSSARQADGTG